MRSIKIAGMLFVLVLVVSAVASASAVAAPEFLGTLPTSITGTSGEGELTDPASGLVIKCKKDKVSGKVLTATTVEATVDFETCKIGGFAAQSLGDKSGIILVPVTGKLCYINKANKEVGTLFVLPEGGIHIEVPSLGELLVITGSVVGLSEPVNTASTEGKVKVAGSKTCELTKAEKEAGADVLTVEKEHNGSPLSGEEITTETLTFGNTLTLDA